MITHVAYKQYNGSNADKIWIGVINLYPVSKISKLTGLKIKFKNFQRQVSSIILLPFE